MFQIKSICGFVGLFEAFEFIDVGRINDINLNDDLIFGNGAVVKIFDHEIKCGRDHLGRIGHIEVILLLVVAVLLNLAAEDRVCFIKTG